MMYFFLRVACALLLDVILYSERENFYFSLSDLVLYMLELLMISDLGNSAVYCVSLESHY